AQDGGAVDVLVGPVAGNVGEDTLALIGAAEEADRDGGELSAGDGGVGIEEAAGLAGDDAGVGQGGGGVVEPVAAVGVHIDAVGAPVHGPGLVGQHTEEDGGHLGAGDGGHG